MIKVAFILIFVHIVFPGFGQEEKRDTSVIMDEVIVRAFEQNSPLKSVVTPVQVLRLKNEDATAKSSFVSVFNTVAGVRMEERSPGSYRLNIRGSSLRSPFGVRNVKVYWNDIPVTDPGGNTYLNQFAWNNIASVEIYKGPVGSMYGAGTGGLILLDPFGARPPGINAEYTYGSYGLRNLDTKVRFGHDENMNEFSYSHTGSDGYRIQSKMRRDNLCWVSRLKLSDRQQFSASFLYSDLYYQTPGALTIAELNVNPRAARPAAGGLPSAVDARAAIKQTSFLAGFSHYYKINSTFSNQTTFYGSFVELNNPAIRNYERRNEPAFGGRTLFIFKNKNDRSDWKVVAGGEFQHGFFNTIVFKNISGKPDTIQTNDDIVNSTNSYFIQGDATIKKDLFLTAGFSVNRSKVNFSRLNQFPILTRTRYYKDEVAPRIALKKQINNDLSATATISRGFSPPTIAELLPSNSVLNTSLEAEYGWNYELNTRYYLFNSKLKLEASAFYFKLNKALVQRRDSSGADFFVNAGDVRQKGIELMANYKGLCTKNFISTYELQAAITLNHFRYGTFTRGTNNFSGKTVPSVPGNTVSVSGRIYFKHDLYASFNYYGSASLFLNDANTAKAAGYNLLATRVGWKKIVKTKFVLGIFAGIDNVLDESYSLGNDINAPAGRFYNPATTRNYYTGLSFQWISEKK